MPADSPRRGRRRNSKLPTDGCLSATICREIERESLYKFTAQICSLIGSTKKLIRLQIDGSQSDLKAKCFGDLRSPTSLAPLGLRTTAQVRIFHVGATLLAQERKMMSEKDWGVALGRRRWISPSFSGPAHNARPARSYRRKSPLQPRTNRTT